LPKDVCSSANHFSLEALVASLELPDAPCQSENGNPGHNKQGRDKRDEQLWPDDDRDPHAASNSPNRRYHHHSALKSLMK
jgi:hypothetical protein